MANNEILIAIDNFIYNGFTNVIISKSIENISGKFSFSTTVLETENRLIQNPIKVQSKVEIFVDSELVLTGKIEDLSVNYNPTSHTIVASGRDSSGDLVDCSIIQKQYKERNLEKLLKLVLSDNGYSNIEVINDLPVPAILPETEVVRTEINDSIFSFIDKYARRLQVFVLTDPDGNLTISTEGFTGAGGALISRKNGAENNIISANLNINSNDRFNLVEIYSQSSNNTFAKSSILQRGSATDSQIAAPRRKIIIAEKATQTAMLNKLAQWNVSVRRAKSQRYNCQVAGFYTGRDNGLLWEINTVASVFDDKCDLDGQYLIEGVEFNKSDNGSFTNLTLVELGSFTIDPEKKFKSFSKNNKTGNIFFKKASKSTTDISGLLGI